MRALQASCCWGDVNYEAVFPDSGATPVRPLGLEVSLVS